MADAATNSAAVFASNSSPTILSQFNSGAACTAGMLVYLDPATNTWKPFDSDAGSVAGGNVTDQRGIALNNGANGQPLDVCAKDIAFTPGFAVANGVSYYGSRNAGAVTADVPAAGNVSVFIGTGRNATTINLNPTASGVVV